MTFRDANEASYEWNLGGITLWVATMFPERHNGAAGEHVHAVRISGSRSPGAATGAGIRLGDSMADLLRVYGNRYQTIHRDELSKTSLAVCFVFARDESELCPGFNDKGQIITLELSAAVE